MKQAKIYYLFADCSITYITGKPMNCKPVAWKFEEHHTWKYNNFPSNYYKSF